MRLCSLQALAALTFSVLAACVTPPPLSIGTEALPDGYVADGYAQQLLAENASGELAWSADTAALPPGLSLGSDGTLGGTPSAPAERTITITVTDGAGRTARRSLALVIHPALRLTVPSRLDANVGAAFPALGSAAGGKAPLRWSTAAGSLPPGVALNPVTGALEGAAQTVGTWALAIVVSDANGKTTSASILIRVAAMEIATPAILPDADVGQAYSASLSSLGGRAPVVWSVVDGALPSGLTLSAAGAIGGTISDSVASGALHTFTAEATDAGGTKVRRAFSLTAYRPPEPVATSLPDAAETYAYSQPLELRYGKGPIALAASGLPAGLAFAAATGAIAGTPSTGAAGTYSVLVTATDAANRSTARALPLKVRAAGAATISSLQPAYGSVAGGTVVRALGFELHGATVTVGGQAATATPSSDGRTVTFTVPPGAAAGPAEVVIVNGSGASATAVFTYTLERTISIDALSSDWPTAFRLGASSNASSGSNDLVGLYAAYDGYNLYLAVEGRTGPTDSVLLFVDVDRGSGRGTPLGQIADPDGELDAACSNGGTGTGAWNLSALTGFAADFCVGSKGAASVWLGATWPDNDFAGARDLSVPTNLNWIVDYRGGSMVQVAASTAFDGFTELLIPWAAVYPGRGAPPPGARISLFARIASSDGEVLAAQTLPADDDAAPHVVSQVATFEPLISARPTEPAWYQGANFYEVFVRSFKDSNGDGIGDLDGLTSKLDYLRDLGVDALWLMPIFDSPSYHGYDTVDYGKIDPDFGTLTDFTELCDAAHARGMKVILDLVINHTSSAHPWFVDSASSPLATKRDWYVWSPTDPGWSQPFSSAPGWHLRNGAWYYAAFWEGMPDLNFAHAQVRTEAKRLAAEWLGRGADGFRLDAAPYLIETGEGAGQQHTPETLTFWGELSTHVQSTKAGGMLVSEAWSDTFAIGRYYGDRADPSRAGMQLSFDFPLSGRIFEGIGGESGGPIASKLVEVREVYPYGAINAPFLTNHDTTRVGTQLGSDPALLRLAAALLLTVPGTPFLYYGEEVGLQNGTTGGDESKRTPMPWSSAGGFSSATPWFPFAPGLETENVATQQADPASLWSRYRTLLRLRRDTPALSRGQTFELLSSLGSTPSLVFIRGHGPQRVLVAHNLSGATVTTAPLAVTGTLATLFADPGADATVGQGGWTLTLPARGSAIWRIE